ncbi:NosD domain-containing protein [Malonomonas rubra]|uniref:NosD domain-containing protein n=1 Tax=Malonomonas rubra TaxID=57040 RepID=UPI0026EF6A61|nr:NosD domain-containing protein [Malonomonas rubra]
MRKLFVLSILLVLFGCAGHQPVIVDPLELPQISGTIPSDLVLDGQYLLAADLQVPTGLILTIKPGTTVYVQPSDSTKIDPEFLSRETEVLIRGTLNAVGTEAQPIVFKPIGEDRDAILWSGLQLVDSVGSELAHLRIEQAEAGLLCLNSSPNVLSLQVQRSRYGILLQQQSAPQIRDSLLTSGEAGLFCWDQSAPQVRNSRIVHLQEEGLYLGRDCRGAFSGNLIGENDRGVILPAGVVFDESNHVAGNRLDFVRYGQEAN